MKIAYHMPSLHSIYAYRTIYWGFKNAFEDMGHEFVTFTSDDSLDKFLEREQPDIFMTLSHFYYQKYLNLDLLASYRKKGMLLFTKLDFWNPMSELLRKNESMVMRDEKKLIASIKDGMLGDVFYHVVEQGDLRMDGFSKVTGQNYVTIPLAADKIALKPSVVKRFEVDVAYLGTMLPAKKSAFEEYLYPIPSKGLTLGLYGQDWTARERILGKIQRGGQYFNIPLLRSIQKPKFKLEDEARIYASAKISINLHEYHQREFGGDCNERTFKIPLCGGFELTDDVACMHKYFKDDELVTAKNTSEWFDKLMYYSQHADERSVIMEKGKKRVLADHTYNNRAQQILDIAVQKKN